MLIKDFKGIGPKKAENFKKVKIETIDDLLFTLPKMYHRYELKKYSEAEYNEKFVTYGKIASKLFYKPMRKNLGLTGFTIEDERKNKIYVKIFGSQFYQFKYRMGQNLYFYGRKKDNNSFYVEKIFEKNIFPKIEPVYKLEDIPDNLIRNLLESYLKNHRLNCQETIPIHLVKKYRLLDINNFIIKAHFPTDNSDLKELNRRIKYKNFFKYALSIEIQNSLNNYILKKPKKLFNDKISEFIKILPFRLTTSQENTLLDIQNDMSSSQVMNRLVQGDVGSGKTIIAVIASYIEVLNKGQVIILAPTEILAKQHFINFKNYLDDYGISIDFLSSSVSKKNKIDVLERVKAGITNILVTTHSLMYHDIEFQKLGLYIVDEQHRFGVSARRHILEKYQDADSIYLSATPIPRTLGLTKYANMSISSLKEKPSDRKKIETKVYTYGDLEFVFNDMRLRINRGEQIYAVVSVIEAGDLNLLDIKNAYELIEEGVKEARIGIIHGSLKQKDKDEVMTAFKNHELDILLATTVIEVGVDVKNATAIYIFDAKQFGLSTIHQLRGRVGRNDKEAFCALITDRCDILRLKYLEEIDDCFELAELDLKLRGPGDLLGDKQSGFLTYDLLNDGKIFSCAKDDAKEEVDKFNKGTELDLISKRMIEKITNQNIKLN